MPACSTTAGRSGWKSASATSRWLRSGRSGRSTSTSCVYRMPTAASAAATYLPRSRGPAATATARFGWKPSSRAKGDRFSKCFRNAASLERLILLAQHTRRDLEFQDLVRPLVDPAHPHVDEVPPRPVQRGPTPPAEGLHRSVGRVPRGVRRKVLRLRCQQV